MDKLNASAVYGPGHEGMTTHPTGAHDSAFVLVRRAYTPISGDQTTIDQRLKGKRATGNVWSAPGVFVAATVVDVARYESMRDEFFFDLY
jgi:GH43 family beta-xylosidase